MNKGKELKYKKIIKNLKKDEKCNVFEESLKENLQDEYETCLYDLDSILFQKKNNLLKITDVIMRDLKNIEINKFIDQKNHYVYKFSDEIDKVLEEETKISLYGDSSKESINKYLQEIINKPIDFKNEYGRILKSIDLELKSCELINDSLKVIKEYINCDNVKN